MPIQTPTSNSLPWTVMSAWNPNAPGNKPGLYGGYYDAYGFLHCSEDEVPYVKETGYPTVGFYDEYGYYQMTQEEVENAPEPPYPKNLSKEKRTPIIREWNPDAPGNKPGEYGGYYDANGVLHCKYGDVPQDSNFYPVVSFVSDRGNIWLSWEDSNGWNPNGMGTTPGPYGGYYDAEGNLHCKDENVPRDACGYPVVCFRDEHFSCLTYVEKQKSHADERRIDAGFGRGFGEAELTDDDLKKFEEAWGWSW